MIVCKHCDDWVQASPINKLICPPVACHWLAGVLEPGTLHKHIVLHVYIYLHMPARPELRGSKCSGEVSSQVLQGVPGDGQVDRVEVVQKPEEDRRKINK